MMQCDQVKLNQIGLLAKLIFYKSPLPLTNPRDAVRNAHRVAHRCGQSV